MGIEIKTTISFITFKNKICRCKYNKHVQGVHAESYTMLMKEIKEYLNKCGDIPYSLIESRYTDSKDISSSQID